MLYKNHKPTAENITLLYTCACLTWLESTLLESMETAVDEDSLSTAQKKKKAIEIDHGPVQRSFVRVNYPCYILSCRETDHHFGLC